jgi:hypothetical protein
MPEFELTDAIGLFNTRIAAQNAYWSYYSAVALGVLGFLGAQPRPTAVKRLLIGGFLFFCTCNGAMIFITQSDLVTISAAIQTYLAKHTDAVPPPFDPIMNRIFAYPLWWVLTFYILVSASFVFIMSRMKSGTAGAPNPAAPAADPKASPPGR